VNKNRDVCIWCEKWEDRCECDPNWKHGYAKDVEAGRYLQVKEDEALAGQKDLRAGSVVK
jgi:hypothetical protein